VFGDLHGRILPAFRLALAWQREQGEPLAGLLQVGDLGYFPDPTRLDKATRRHAERDPLELGAGLIANRSKEADALFAEPDLPDLWFIPGNHEDYDALEALAHGAGCTRDDFPVDYYQRVRCVRDGQVVALPGNLRVGGLWGIDGKGPLARRDAPPRGRINTRNATRLSVAGFDVLLTHDSPLDAVFPDAGSEEISSVIRQAQPAFAFFGHYGSPGQLSACDFGATQVFHLHGFELRGSGGTAEEGSVGVLRWDGQRGEFEYLSPKWLRTFTRHNWQHR
jgi:hypothetical protein